MRNGAAIGLGAGLGAVGALAIMAALAGPAELLDLLSGGADRSAQQELLQTERDARAALEDEMRRARTEIDRLESALATAERAAEEAEQEVAEAESAARAAFSALEAAGGAGLIETEDALGLELIPEGEEAGGVDAAIEALESGESPAAQ